MSADCNDVHHDQSHFLRTDVASEPGRAWFGYWESNNPDWNTSKCCSYRVEGATGKAGSCWTIKGTIRGYHKGHQRVGTVGMRRGTIAEVTGDDLPVSVCHSRQLQEPAVSK